MLVTEELFNKLAKGLIAWSAILFLSLQFTKAEYGRYVKSTRYVINSKLAWFIQEIPALLVPVALLCFTECQQIRHLPNTILFCLYGGHYFQRIFIYPFFLKGRPLPLYMVLLALVFCGVNGFLQGGYLLYSGKYEEDWYLHPQFIVGVGMFVLGLCINIHSDHILRNLREPGDSGYKIPTGGLFEYISGANFFGEIMEWWGFALASNSLPAIAFAISTTCNLGPRAFHHHRWYKEKFEDYPTTRKALVPLLL